MRCAAAAAERARTQAPRGRAESGDGLACALLTWRPAAAVTKPRKAVAQTEHTHSLAAAPGGSGGDTLLPSFWRPPARLGPHPGPLRPLLPSQGLLLALAASPPPEGPCHPESPPHLKIPNQLTPEKPLLVSRVLCSSAVWSHLSPGSRTMNLSGALSFCRPHPWLPPGLAPARHSVNVRGGSE